MMRMQEKKLNQELIRSLMWLKEPWDQKDEMLFWIKVMELPLLQMTA